MTPGAIIGDGDRNSKYLCCPCDARQFFYFENNLGYRVRHTRVHAVRGFCSCLMLLALATIRLCLLKYCFSDFVVSCSSLSEVRHCPI